MSRVDDDWDAGTYVLVGVLVVGGVPLVLLVLAAFGNVVAHGLFGTTDCGADGVQCSWVALGWRGVFAGVGAPVAVVALLGVTYGVGVGTVRAANRLLAWYDHLAGGDGS